MQYWLEIIFMRIKENDTFVGRETEMVFDNFEYIKTETLSGDIRTDVKNMLLANGKYNTYIHVANVAERNALIAETYDLDRDKCIIAGFLHDISAVIRPEDMLKYASENCWDICEAEKKYPFLLHQRLSKICAADYYNISDEQILSAIECHATLKKCPSKYEMALFIADKLAWDKSGKPPFYEEVNGALDISLEAACYKYMVDNDMILCPHDSWIAAYEQLKN